MALFDRKKTVDPHLDAAPTTVMAAVPARAGAPPDEAVPGDDAGGASLLRPKSGNGAGAAGPAAPSPPAGRAPTAPPAAAPSAGVRTPPAGTRIGEAVTLEGALRLSGAARIDGVVKGRIESADRLEVGPDAEVTAEVKVGMLVLHGVIAGNVRATQSVEIHEEGELRGDLRTPALQVHRGALFFGHCDMGGDE